MAKHAHHDYLRRVPLFADLADDELDAVGRTATELRFAPGAVLMKEGAIGHEMVVVLEGSVEVTRKGEHVADIGPGGFAGEMALLTQATRNSTVAATSDVVVIHLDGRSFWGLLEDVPRIALSMLPIVAGRVNAINDYHSPT